MDLNNILGNFAKTLLTNILNNNMNLPQVQSITNSLTNSSQGSVTGEWDNLNSSSILVILTILGALLLNRNCYGNDKGVWIDRCIRNQIVFLILLSLLFNLESKVIPSTISATGTTGVDSGSEVSVNPNPSQDQSDSSQGQSNATGGSGSDSGTSSGGITISPNNSITTTVESCDNSKIEIKYNNNYY